MGSKKECPKHRYEGGEVLFKFVSPFVFIGLPIGWHFANPCSNYVTQLTWSTFGIFLFAFLMTYITAIILIPDGFCTCKQKKDHLIFWMAYWNCLGASLGAYDFYTFSLNVYSTLWAVVMWMLVFILMIPNFCKGPMHSCPGHDDDDTKQDDEPVNQGRPMCKCCGRREWWAASTILMGLAWAALPAFMIVWDPDLRDGVRDSTMCVV